MKPLRILGLFAGVGGIELGMERAGHSCSSLCEIDPYARAVLKRHFPHAELVEDVRDMRLPAGTDLITAGFPCQDLSQVGSRAGIKGKKSGLVGHLLRLLERGAGPDWLLLENVPFMLVLNKGAAMTYLTEELTRLGYSWAYRVVDSRSFGLPQRRRRVILLASRSLDPRNVLFVDDHPREDVIDDGTRSCGFYWTEGNRGIGWAVDCIPTLKGGSGLGIPSPPAIWSREDDMIGTPDILDAERLQGFPQHWTKPAEAVDKRGTRQRWKLVGNAVSVPLAKWIGKRLNGPGEYDASADEVTGGLRRWPTAAWGHEGLIGIPRVSEWPCKRYMKHLTAFLKHPLQPLSLKATCGFHSRYVKSPLKQRVDFVRALERHISRMSGSGRH